TRRGDGRQTARHRISHRTGRDAAGGFSAQPDAAADLRRARGLHHAGGSSGSHHHEYSLLELVWISHELHRGVHEHRSHRFFGGGIGGRGRATQGSGKSGGRGGLVVGPDKALFVLAARGQWYRQFLVFVL